MKAIQSDVQTFLEGSKQFVLPLYQRRYSWHVKHWTTLARDLDRLMQESIRPSHFIGSFVTAPLNHAADQSVSRYRLIDGQQRLTTILILLAALRDVADEHGLDELAAEVQGLYLSNQYKKGDAARKLVPTRDDESDLSVLMRRPASPAPGRMGDAYRFFVDELRKTPARLADARRAMLGRLSVVSITLEVGDDPHLIFESLNAKGERLTQADLLRNYFLMRLPQADADYEFARSWQPMQQDLGDDLTNFFRHYLMRDAEGAEVRRDEVYDQVKERVDRDALKPADVVNQLDKIRRHAANYARLVRPNDFEPDAEIAARIRRLHRLKVTTAYPLLLNIMESTEAGRLSVPGFARLLDTIEAFLIRRLACGVATNQLRTIFRGLCNEASGATDDASFLLTLRAALSQNQRCPSDAAFRDAIARRPLYVSNKRDAARYLLERIEHSFDHKEAVNPDADGVQLEHVMPQTLTDAWRSELNAGDHAATDEVHGQWLHTLGNLTLTGYNPELGNQPFAAKKIAFAESNFSVNRYFANIDSWNAAAIEARGHTLAERAIAIWPDFAPPRAAAEAIAGARGLRRRVPPPLAVVLNGTRYPVESNLDATHTVLRHLHLLDAGTFGRALAKSFPKRRRNHHSQGMRAPREIAEDTFVDLHGSGKWLRQRCLRMVASMGLSATALKFEENNSG